MYACRCIACVLSLVGSVHSLCCHGGHFVAHTQVGSNLIYGLVFTAASRISGGRAGSPQQARGGFEGGAPRAASIPACLWWPLGGATACTCHRHRNSLAAIKNNHQHDGTETTQVCADCKQTGRDSAPGIGCPCTACCKPCCVCTLRDTICRPGHLLMLMLLLLALTRYCRRQSKPPAAGPHSQTSGRP